MISEKNWRKSAECQDWSPSDFFDPWDEETDKLDVERLARVQRFTCLNCPVRRQCLDHALTIERGSSAEMRFGLWAYLTPGQREAIEKRGIARCPRCDSMRDPVLLAQGRLECPINCGQPDRQVSPPPFDGDQWTSRHTTLSKRIVAWIVDNTDPGDGLPTPSRMADLMGGIRRSDVLRVYTALVEDGTVDRTGAKQSPVYSRGAKVASRNWTPNWSD